MSLHLRRDFARTVGDALLHHVYAAAGGDGKKTVRVEPYRAAVMLTGDARPSRAEVGYARDVLYALLGNPTPRYAVQRCPDVEGAYLIQPRPKNAPPAA